MAYVRPLVLETHLVSMTLAKTLGVIFPQVILGEEILKFMNDIEDNEYWYT